MTDQLPEDGAPIPKHTLVALFITMATALVGVGAAIGIATSDPGGTFYHPKDLSPKELTQSGEYRVKPNTIVLNFVDPTQIPKICHDQYAFACSKTYERPCQIYLPADIKISYWPDEQEAVWSDFHFNETISHEILHCYAPNWHQPWTDKFPKWLSQNYK